MANAILLNTQAGDKTPEFEKSEQIAIFVKTNAGVKALDTLEYDLIIEDSLGNSISLPGTVFIERDPA